MLRKRRTRAILLAGLALLFAGAATLAGATVVAEDAVMVGLKHTHHHARATKRAQGTQVQVFVTRKQMGGLIEYHYRVSNKSKYPIADVMIGLDHGQDRPEVKNPPGGWDVDDPPDSTYDAPPEWDMDFVATRGDTVGFVEWDTEDAKHVIHPGRSASGFTLKVTLDDDAYLHGDWTAMTMSDGDPYFSAKLVPDPLAGRTRRGLHHVSSR